MKVGLGLLVVIVGCASDTSTSHPLRCSVDVDCDAGEICAGDASCRAPPDVRTIDVQWTVAGHSASQACTVEEVRVNFKTGPVPEPHTEFGHSPIACRAGAVTVVRVPYDYWIGGVYTLVPNWYGGDLPIGDDDTVAIDLPY